jgi:hypothetical protein
MRIACGLTVLVALVWVALLGAAPPAHNQPIAVYENSSHSLFAFGGWHGKAVLAGAWAWDSGWTARLPGPPARGSHAMAHDTGRATTVLFGGEDLAGDLADTWLYARQQWRAHAGDGPPARNSHHMAYDSRRALVVLFGGVTGKGQPFGDTWEWDGAAWKRRAVAGPPARFHHGMTYDAVQRRTVVFGGKAAFGRDAASLGDMWTWDGVTWRQAEGAMPTPRVHPAMAYDAQRAQVVLFGGWDRRHLGDTWLWNGSVWQRMAVPGPSPRAAAALVYDDARHAVVLYGGTGPDGDLADLWIWDGARWTAVE